MDNDQMLDRVAVNREAIEKAFPTAEPALDKGTPKPEPTPDTAAPPAEQDAEAHADSAPADGDDPAATEPTKKKVEPWFQKVIDKKTWEKHEAERRAELAEQRLAAYEQQTAQPQPQLPQGRPTLEAYGYDQDAYETAHDAWVISEAEKRVAERFQQAQAQHAAQQKLSTVQERIAAFEKEVPGGWQQAMQAPMDVTPAMLETIADSDIGPKMAYYLSQHLDEAKAIAGMTPVGQVRALGRLEERLSVTPAPVKSVSKAPPVPPVGQSTAKVTTPLAEQSIEDRVKAIRAHDKARGR